MKVSKLNCALGLSILTGLVLAGCGGGGSSSTPVNVTPAINKYLGTWKTACLQDGSVTDTNTSPNNPAYSQSIILLTGDNISQLTISSVHNFYYSTDTTCTNPILAITQTSNVASAPQAASGVRTINGSGVSTITYNGTTTIASGQSVDEITITLSDPTSGISGVNGTSYNGFSFAANYFNTQPVNDIMYLNGNTISFGTLTGNTSATSYPTTLNTRNIWTKQ